MGTNYLAPSLVDQGYIGATGTTPYKLATSEQLVVLQNLYYNSPSSGVSRTISASAMVGGNYSLTIANPGNRSSLSTIQG